MVHMAQKNSAKIVQVSEDFAQWTAFNNILLYSARYLKYQSLMPMQGNKSMYIGSSEEC